MTQSMHEAPRLPSPAEPLCLLAMCPRCCHPSYSLVTTKFEGRMTECWDKHAPCLLTSRSTRPACPPSIKCRHRWIMRPLLAVCGRPLTTGAFCAPPSTCTSDVSVRSWTSRQFLCSTKTSKGAVSRQRWLIYASG